jgi:hypothetical protein
MFVLSLVKVAANGQVLTQWRQQRSNSIGPFTYTKLRVHHFSLIFTFALQTLIQLTDVALPMVRPPAAIAPIPLLAAAAMIGAVPSARVAAADLFVLLPGLVMSVRLFCPGSAVDRNRYVAHSCCSSRLLKVISLSFVLLQSGAFS